MALLNMVECAARLEHSHTISVYSQAKCVYLQNYFVAISPKSSE